MALSRSGADADASAELGGGAAAGAPCTGQPLVTRGASRSRGLSVADEDGGLGEGEAWPREGDDASDDGLLPPASGRGRARRSSAAILGMGLGLGQAIREAREARDVHRASYGRARSLTTDAPPRPVTRHRRGTI